MIIKYYNKGEVRYLSGINNVVQREIDYRNILEDNKDKGKEFVEFLNGVRLSDDVIASNIVFDVVSEEYCNSGKNITSYNSLDGERIRKGNGSVYAFILELESKKKVDLIIIISNQNVYLMNDDGKTIDKLL